MVSINQPLPPFQHTTTSSATCENTTTHNVSLTLQTFIEPQSTHIVSVNQRSPTYHHTAITTTCK